MFDPTMMDFDLGLLQDEPCTSIFHDEGPANVAAPSKTLEQQMEEDKIGWLEATSDLQAFMDIGTLPEVKGNEDVENVINDVEKLIQQYDDIDNQQQQPAAAAEDDLEILPPEEMAAAEELLDELLKSEGLELDFDLDTTELNAPPSPKESVAEVKQETFFDLTNVTKIVREDGEEVFIMIVPPCSPKAEPVEEASCSSDPDYSPEPKTKGRPTLKRQPKKTRKAPYIVDKKERKKQQNVEAARRYRDKKKSEQEDVEEVERVLSVKNKELKSQVSELEAEVKTMKKLMLELGILKQ